MPSFLKIASTVFFVILFVFEISAEGTWTTFTNGNYVQDIAIDGRYVWCGTLGGVVRWDKADMSYKKFTTSDGLSGNGINSLKISPNGDVWVATYDGVSKFDGKNWTNYYKSDGLPMDGAMSLGISPDGTVWVGTSTRQVYSGAGISRYDGKQWDTFTRDDGLVSNTIKSIAVTPDGVVWAGNIGGGNKYDGVSLFNNGTWTAIPEDEYLALYGINSITVAPDGNVWIGSYEGLSCFDGSTWTTIPLNGSMENAHIRSAAVAQNGDIWTAVWFTRYAGDPEINIGIAKYDGENWTTYSVDDGLPDNYVNTIIVDDNGILWAGTIEGLCRYDGGTWTAYKTVDEMAQSEVRSLGVGDDGTVWVGTWGKGISRFDGKTWDTFTADDGLLSNRAVSLYVLPGGDIWTEMITSSGYRAGLCHYDGKRWNNYTEDDIVDMSEVTLLGVDPEGNVWCSDTGGMFRYDGRRWHEVISFDPGIMKNDNLFAFGPGNLVWYESQYGVITCYDEISFKSYTVENGLPSWQFWSISIGPDGMPWVASTYKELSRFDGEKWITQITEFELSNLMFDRNGTLWCSATDSGVLSYDGIRWIHFTTKDGLAGNSVRAIEEGPDGSIWFGTSNGLSRYTPLHTTIIESYELQPTGISSIGNYPNPFNQTTTIGFVLPKEAIVNLSIYNIMGQKVRTLLSETKTAGTHSILWDGKDDTGNNVSSGVYITRLNVGQNSIGHHMLFMK